MATCGRISSNHTQNMSSLAAQYTCKPITISTIHQDNVSAKAFSLQIASKWRQKNPKNWGREVGRGNNTGLGNLSFTCIMRDTALVSVGDTLLVSVPRGPQSTVGAFPLACPLRFLLSRATTVLLVMLLFVQHSPASAPRITTTASNRTRFHDHVTLKNAKNLYSQDTWVSIHAI